MGSFVVLTLIGSICLRFDHVTGQTADDAKRLRTKLFTTDGYDYRVRPQDDQSIPIDVTMNFHLLNINSLNEVTETLKTTGYLEITWDDDYLVWNPTDYGGITYQHWPQGDVWKPDVALKNSFTDYKELGVTSLRVYVDNNGSVSWLPFQVFQSTCSVDITYYPFDTQRCSLTFGAWSYSKHEVNILSDGKGIILDEYEKSPTWDLLSVNWKIQNDEDGDAEISFVLKIKRKPLNAILTMIVPVVMLSVLNLFVFMLPCSSGEKASYSVTVFLAFAVFLTIIAASLPDNSESIAYFSIYLIIQTTQSTLINLAVLTLIRVNSFEKENAVPRFLVFITRLMKCGLCRRRSKLTLVESFPEKAKSANQQKKTRDSDTKKSLQNGSLDKTQEGDDESFSWEEVVNSVDLFLFVIFATIFAVSTLVCFVIAATQ